MFLKPNIYVSMECLGDLGAVNFHSLAVERSYHCREIFLEDWEVCSRYSKKYFYIVTKSKNEKGKDYKENVISFISFIENLLHLSKSSKLQFINCENNNRLLIVKLSKWWSTDLRMSLLTILLRAGLKYKGSQNVDDIFKLHGYLKDTREATLKFLSGSTKVKTNAYFYISNWRDHFGGVEYDKTEALESLY